MKLLIIFLLFSPFWAFSQQPELSTHSKKAIKLYNKATDQIKQRQFSEGIATYKKAVRIDENFSEAYARLGSIYFTLRKQDSVKYFYEKYILCTPTEKQNAAILQTLAKYYFEAGSYLQADQTIQTAIDKKTEIASDPQVILMQKNISFALNNRDSVFIEHIILPQSVNRFFTQYFPSMTIDGNTLFFTKRDGFQPYQDEDIVVSYFRNGTWSESESVAGIINSSNNEGAATVSADGRILIFTSCDEGKTFGSCDLFITIKEGMVWTKPQNMGMQINSQYWESQPSLSADGKVLYYSSNRPGGVGARDLYVSFFDQKVWNKPQNLGPAINTAMDEVTPYIHVNGETLLFASNGHIGFGGYDLFITEKDSVGWRIPRNLGNRINNHRDQLAMIISSDGSKAFFSEEMMNANNEIVSKIAEIAIPSDSLLSHRVRYVTGRVRDAVTQKPLKASIELYDLTTHKAGYITTSDPVSGQYFFVLTQGKQLGVFVTSPGYLIRDFEFEVSSTSPLAPDTVNILLDPMVLGASVILKNIYFEFNSYTLDDKSKAALMLISRFLVETKQVVEIQGHTDAVGTEKYNFELSQKRANAVYTALRDLGVNERQMRATGYGYKKPLFFDEASKYQNRRIEFKIIGQNQ